LIYGDADSATKKVAWSVFYFQLTITIYFTFEVVFISYATIRNLKLDIFLLLMCLILIIRANIRFN
jgi:hypothetical protein